MSDQHGPTVCQMVGEPYSQAWVCNCVDCKIKTCPIRAIFKILEEFHPQAIRELKEEAEMIRHPSRAKWVVR